MKNFLLLLLVLTVLNCASDDDTSSGTPEFTEYFFQTEKQILFNEEDFGSFTTIESGNNLVFTYKFEAAQEDAITDDEYGETIIFEIDPSLDTFTFTNDQLADIQTYFETSCFCMIEASAITQGTISGTKVSATVWNIVLDVTFERFGETLSRSLSEPFKLRE